MNNKKITICFLAVMYSKIDSHSRHWINYFIKKGYNVHIITFFSDTIKECENVKLYFMKEYRFKFLTLLMNVIKVRRVVKKISPDILHAHYIGVNGALGVLSGIRPLVVTAYGSDILQNSKSVARRILLKYILKKADIITCNGEPLKRKAVELGADARKINFIFWATNTEKFKKSEKSGNLKKALNIKDYFSVISIRNLDPVYDVETLIRAIPLVLEKIPKVKFIIAGIGSQEDRLKKLSEALKISEAVQFVGWLEYDDMPQYLNLADIYVSTSLSDGDLSQSTQQAMACEVPVIITDLEVNKKRIIDGKNGIIFPQRDFESLSQKIIFLINDKKLRKILGGEERKTIVKELDFNKNMEKAEDLYKNLMNEYKIIKINK